MNIIEQLQREQTAQVVVNQRLKSQLRQELFATPVRPSRLAPWLAVLRSPLFMTVSTSVVALVIVVSLFITPAHSVSAEAMLRIATAHMIPELQPGQVFYVRTQHKNRSGQIDHSVELWFDGKNIRTEEINADGSHVVRLDLLQENGYEYSHYEYDFVQNHITQYQAPDMRLMAQTDPAVLPELATGEVSFLTDPEANEILFGNDLVESFIDQANNSPTNSTCGLQPLDQPTQGNIMYPTQNTKIDFSGQETIDGITYVKIKMVTFQNDDVTDIHSARNYHEFWIDQATGRMRQQRQVIHDEVREATYYSAGEVLQPGADYFTLAQWQQDYAISEVPINLVQPETQLESGDIMLMVEAY